MRLTIGDPLMGECTVATDIGVNDPLTSNISSVNLRSGSNPRLPPGEDSNRKVKSEGNTDMVCVL